jgi:uncharacterized protein
VTPLEFIVGLGSLSLLAGFLGSLLGLGGGIIVVPALTLFFGIDIRYAIGASIVSVIATSSGAGAGYVRRRMANVRLAMLLEVGTTTGAITGAFVSGLVHERYLFLTFGAVLVVTSLAMFRRPTGPSAPVPPDSFADRLRLHDSFYDEAAAMERSYRVARTKLGVGMMYFAGVISGLLGIGSGALNVPAMDLAMRLPIKVSTATSNFVMGVTAAASAGVFFARGDIDPFIAAPVALGVTAGSLVGSRVMARTQNRVLRIVFVVILLLISSQMIWKGLR